MSDVKITPSEDGPYLTSGDVHLTDIDGREIPHRPVHLIGLTCIPPGYST